MIALVVLVALIALLAWVVPVIAATVTRNVISGLDRSPASGSIDQSVVEARLSRIEEAIDAMAVEIERLSDHQRALLGPASTASVDEEANRLRTETPR